ncbi:MAG: HAMP domain-containing histidine kinase [Gammaproteobacteria bacterium]|nr:MAG: HAMP domain-containing histidine kinase [Gammaproteobacteria bacterium]
MRLQQSFFLWIAISAIIPLTLLILGLTIYGEKLYQQQIGREINASLSNIITDLDRDLAYERRIMLEVANSPTMQQYMPVLEAALSGHIHSEFYERTESLNQFLLSFSTIVQGQGVLRVLDLSGNSLIKVSIGQYAPPAFDGIESFPYAEQERESIDDNLHSMLLELPTGSVSFINLLKSSSDQALLDGVVPLVYNNQRVGYLSTSLSGEQLDYILQLAPRIYDGQLLIVEANPDDTERDGYVMYDDKKSLLFSTPGDSSRDEEIDILLAASFDKPDGHVQISDQQQTLYYNEFFPYPDRLLNWIIALRVDHRIISKPFEQIRYAIIFFALIALLASLIAAHFGADRITKPVLLLVENLRALAQGKDAARATISGTEEIQELNAAFNFLQDNLEAVEKERDRAHDMMLQNAKLASIGQLAAGIGHELNNPLNNILSYAKLIGRELESDLASARDDLATLEEEGQRASRIVQDILNFSRQVPAHFADFQLSTWLEQTINLVQSTARKKNVTIDYRIDQDITVKGDRGLLQQAVINLIINAIQASPEGGNVLISIEHNDENYVLSVRDMGKGINPEIMDRLFDPFFTTKDTGEGTGLGLSITLGIVEQHGGALQVENITDGHGVIVRMALPVKPDEINHE